MRKSLGNIFLYALLSCSLAATAQQDLKSLVQKAFDLHQKGAYSGALPLLRRAYDLDSNDYFVNLLLGIDLLRTGAPKDSVPHLKKASRLRPKEEFPLDYLGEAYARQQLYGEASEAYLKALSVAPASSDSAVAFVDFAVSRFAGISALLRSSKRGLAAEYHLRALALPESDPSRMAMLQRAADLDDRAPGIWTELASAALGAGEGDGAEAFLRRALQADPNDLSAWIVDAQLAAQQSDWKRTLERLNAVALRSPTELSLAVRHWPSTLVPSSSVSLSRATATFFACLKTGKPACGITTDQRSSPKPTSALYREQRWEQVVKLPPPQDTQSEAWVERGVAYARLNDCRRAIPALERGLSRSGSEIFGMFLVSWCYSGEAGRTADRVQKSGVNEGTLHVMRGDILLRLQGKPDLAVFEYQKAKERSPNDPALLERLAEAHFGAGQTDAAREKAQAALKIDPSRLGAKRTLAKIAMQERDYGTALAYLRELADREPQDITIRIDLGRACAQTGALNEALQNLSPALAQGYPDEKGSLHSLLGTVLKKMGRTEEAGQAFAEAAHLSDAFQQKSYRDQDPDAQP